VGLVLTGASAGSASPSVATASSKVITLTSSTSSSAGHLTVRLKYDFGPHDSIRVVSAAYSGGSPLRFAHPALVVTFRPVLSPSVGRVTKVKGRSPFGPLILKIRDARAFSGRFPVRDLPRLSWKSVGRKGKPGPGPSLLIESAIGSVSTAGKSVTIESVVGLQVGIVLGPVGP
jgi:hypothetical protein